MGLHFGKTLTKKKKKSPNVSLEDFRRTRRKIEEKGEGEEQSRGEGRKRNYIQNIRMRITSDLSKATFTFSRK